MKRVASTLMLAVLSVVLCGAASGCVHHDHDYYRHRHWDHDDHYYGYRDYHYRDWHDHGPERWHDHDWR